MDFFLNKSEDITFRKIEELCEKNNARLFAKARMADILSVSQSGLSERELSFALKSHIDFLITDEKTKPLFAVEFDGPYHRSTVQKYRDDIKNDICKRHNLPLLRINMNFLKRQYRGLDLLTYFIEIWFLHSAFQEAQKIGLVPWDEEFDPALICSDGNRPNKTWPYWLSIDIQLAIKRMQTEGLIYDPVVSHWIGIDAEEKYHCLSWIELQDHRFVTARTGIRTQSFPIIESDFLIQIAAFEIYEKLINTIKGKIPSKPESSVAQILRHYEHKYEMRAFFGIGKSS